MHSLMVQLGSAAAMIVLMVLVHGVGVAAIAHWLGLGPGPHGRSFL